MECFKKITMDSTTNILLLGGFGFIGTNILKYIDVNYADKYACIVFDKFTAHPHGLQFDCVRHVYAGDFSDSMLIERVFQENKIDMVFHAISTTVPVNSLNAKYDVLSNLLPTLDVLNNMVKYKVPSIVYLSSGGAIYGTQSEKIHNEDSDVYPISSYGVVKLAIEKYIIQYAQLYNIHPLILRLSNPYGRYHYSMKQGVINIAIKKALHEETLPIWGDGCGRKDYIYIEDVMDIMFKLLTKKDIHGVINIGSGQTHALNDIVKIIQSNISTLKVQHTEAHKFDVSNFELDINKLINIIGNYPFTTLENGIRQTINWTKTLCD